MRFNLINSRMVASRWNLAILCATVCLVWLAGISASAQDKSDKRITAVQLGSAAQGARVTLVSDAGLNDYEAFRRGERFYVRVPSSELATAKPGFRGEGFDDVQVQKVGDGVVVSFKLQPGASARVDQRGNRLEVIFTSVARTTRNRTTPGNTSPTAVSPVTADRQRDAAGPAPSDSSAPSRERYVNERRSASSQQQPAPGSTPEANSRGTSSATNSASATDTPVSNVSPAPQQNYPTWTSSPVTTGTPATSTSRSNGYSANSASQGKQRQTLSGWFAANRTATLIGALILGTVIALLAVFLYRRPRRKAHADRVKPALSQPKYSADDEPDVFSPETSFEVERSSPEPADAFASAAEAPPDWRRTPVEPAFASAHSAPAKGRVNSTPSPSPAFIANGDTSSEEREVFEL